MSASLGYMRRRIRELSEEKEATKREVAELRRVAAKQTESLDTLSASLKLLLGREDDLRAMLVGAHEQLMRRTEEIRATLTAELHQAAMQRSAPEQGASDVRAPVHPVTQSYIPSEYSAYQQLSRHVYYQRLIPQIRNAVRSVLPPGATVIVVSKGDDELLELGDGRRGWHFPQDERGVYAGYYPADSAQAIAHLEELREKGGEFLLFPATAFWWFEQYGEFGRHLDSHYRRVWNDKTCSIYRLSEPQPEDSGAQLA